MSTSSKPEFMEVPDSPVGLDLEKKYSRRCINSIKMHFIPSDRNKKSDNNTVESEEVACYEDVPIASTEKGISEKLHDNGFACSVHWQHHRPRSSKKSSLQHEDSQSLTLQCLKTGQKNNPSNPLLVDERNLTGTTSLNGVSSVKRSDDNVRVYRSRKNTQKNTQTGVKASYNLVNDHPASLNTRFMHSPSNGTETSNCIHHSVESKNQLDKTEYKRKGKEIISHTEIRENPQLTMGDKGKGKEIISGEAVQVKNTDSACCGNRQRSRPKLLANEADQRGFFCPSSSNVVAGSSVDDPVYLSSPEFPGNLSRKFSSSMHSSNFSNDKCSNKDLGLLRSEGANVEGVSSGTNVPAKEQRHFNNLCPGKRRRTQRKNPFASLQARNNCNNSDVVFVSSSRNVQNNLSSTSSTNAVHQNSNYDSDEVFSEGPVDIDGSESSNGHVVHSSQSQHNADARARQIEEDEMLARQLQEELFNEALGEGFQTERTSSRLSTFSSSLAGTSRNPSFSRHIASGRRGRDTLVPARTSVARSSSRLAPPLPSALRRSHILGRFHHPRGNEAFSSRLHDGSTFSFPSYMDLNMRIDLLEAMERATEAYMDHAFLTGIQRDFNENDYDMLLALDENNASRGATQAHINRLPTTVMQGDSEDEICSICLEMPKDGEVIRHLLCTHKFHRDCIDPWLLRQATCPVCKSAI